jgi:hypothetical protein
MENYFVLLNNLDCSGKIEKKNGMNYLSWAFAWGELKKLFPSAIYTVYENKDGYNYHTDGKTCWVKTGVTIEGIEHIEYLPVMDLRNKSILYSAVTSFDVNKSIQRSLTKAVARHGLGLYIYAGEDLPEEEKPQVKPKLPTPQQDPLLITPEQRKLMFATANSDEAKYKYTSTKEIKKSDFDKILQDLK